MARRAPILAVVALALILFGLIAHWMTKMPAQPWYEFGWYSLIHIVVGVIALIGYFAGGSASLGEFVGRRSTRYGVNAVVYSALFLAVLLMINFLGTRYHYRFDVSSEGVNSLSDQSRAILDELDETVSIQAYVDAGRDPVLEELLDAYRYESDKVEVRVIDPQIQPQLAQQAGISQLPTLRVQLGDQSTLVTKAEEEAITNAINRVSAKSRKKIYFMEGHGEASIKDKQTPAALGLFAEALKNQNYDVETLFLPEVEHVPEDASLVILPDAERDYFPHELDALNRYLKGGGNVLAMLEPGRDGDFEELLSSWGASPGSDIVIDQQVRLFAGPTLGMEPIVSKYGNHPAVKELADRTIFSLVRSVTPNTSGLKGVRADTLAMTAPTSWAETDLERLFDKNEASFSDDDKGGPVSIAVAASGPVTALGGEGDAQYQLAVFGDTSFVTNKYWRQLFNDALALNVVGWLAGEQQLISIGPRAIRASRAHLSPNEARTVFYLSVMILPEVILFTGLAVWWRRSNQ